MKLNPSQVAMYLFVGHALPMMGERSLLERVSRGYEMLIKLTNQDFGRDVSVWHNYLREEDCAAYTMSEIDEDIAIKIDEIKSNKEWLLAVSKVCP